MKRLLLVEDDRPLGTTLKSRLEKAGYQVEWCTDNSSSRAKVSQGRFDLAIVDVGLPDGDGFSLAEHLKSVGVTQFLFLTAMSDAQHRLKGYELGAIDYIPKPFHLKELLLRVQRALAFKAPDRIDLGWFKLDPSRMTVSFANQSSITLPLRDFKVLESLVEKAPQIVSREQIAEHIWANEYHPATLRTIDNSVVRLRQIFAKADPTKPTVIRSVRGVGYKLEA